MNIKQRISLLCAAVLPAVALFAYFLIAPAHASACQFYAPCNSGGCSTGAGGCIPSGGCGIYIFCQDKSGVCNNGCVTCGPCH